MVGKPLDELSPLARARELEVLHLIASGAPLPRVLDALVVAVEAQFDGAIASFLLLEGERLRHGAAPRLPPEYTRAIDGVVIGPAVGSCGTAAFTRAPVIVEDVATSPLWADYRGVALPHGLRACWSVPVIGSTGDVLGTFALYYGERRRPAPEQFLLIHHATHMAAIAVESSRRAHALAESEVRARAILDNALDANVLMNAGGVVTQWNARAPEIFGYSVEEAVGRPLADLIIPPEQRAHHAAGLARFTATGHGGMLNRRIRVEAMHRDGRRFPVELAVTPIRLVSGTVFSAFITDITQRQRAEEALSESRRHLSTIYDSVSDVLYNLVVEDMGVYRFAAVNPAFCRVTGLPAEQLVGRLLDEVLPLPVRARALEMCAQAIRTRRTVQWDEVTPWASGQRHEEVVITPAFDAEGRARNLVGATRDVTDRRRLEDELRHLQKMEAIGRLSGGIAHDFNNILGVVLGHASLLLEDLPAGEPRVQVQEIATAAQRGARLTQQFLAFSRKQVLRPEVITLNSVIENLRPMLRRLIGEDVELLTSLASEPWRILADPGQLEQVVVNLVVNARDALERGGTVMIATENVVMDDVTAKRHRGALPGSYAALSVTDNGVGMDEATLKRLFEPFFTTKPPGRGTGLGLATVYGITTQSGGHVQVSSRPGAGSSFTLYFPRTSAERTVGAEASVATTKPPRRQALQVLVVEDDAPLRRVVELALGRMHHRVMVAATPDEAIAHVENSRAAVDLLITDIVLPTMNGRDLSERLRRTNPSLRVLFVSGYPSEAVSPQGDLAGGAPFLRKPFSVSELEVAIAAMENEVFSTGTTGSPRVGA